MPYRNRVTPESAIIATDARGTLMGNRGILHDEHTTIRRNHVGKRWIICLTDFKGRRQQIMPPGHYTQLFFLDEATALAAGHRPCCECQRERCNEFRARWAEANPVLSPHRLQSLDALDAALHAERIAGDRRSGWRKVTYSAQLGELPDGTFVVMPNSATSCLVYRGGLHPWHPEGYGEPAPLEPDSLVQVLTPRSVVNTLGDGYRPTLHPSLQSEVTS